MTDDTKQLELDGAMDEIADLQDTIQDLKFKLDELSLERSVLNDLLDIAGVPQHDPKNNQISLIQRVKGLNQQRMAAIRGLEDLRLNLIEALDEEPEKAIHAIRVVLKDSSRQAAVIVISTDS